VQEQSKLTRTKAYTTHLRKLKVATMHLKPGARANPHLYNTTLRKQRAQQADPQPAKQLWKNNWRA
jgi:hypothetical protein